MVWHASDCVTRWADNWDLLDRLQQIRATGPAQIVAASEYLARRCEVSMPGFVFRDARTDFDSGRYTPATRELWLARTTNWDTLAHEWGHYLHHVRNPGDYNRSPHGRTWVARYEEAARHLAAHLADVGVTLPPARPRPGFRVRRPSGMSRAIERGARHGAGDMADTLVVFGGALGVDDLAAPWGVAVSQGTKQRRRVAYRTSPNPGVILPQRGCSLWLFAWAVAWAVIEDEDRQGVYLEWEAEELGGRIAAEFSRRILDSNRG